MAGAFTRPSLFRRLGSMLYDTILVLALLIIGSGILLFYTKGESIKPGNLYYQIYLLSLIFGFFIWFWTHGGQTAGMAAWRLRLITFSNNPVSFRQALIRLLIATPLLLLGGCGLLWAFYDQEKLTLYDRLSKTKLIRVS